MNELTKIKIRILDRLITCAKDMEKAGALTNDIKVVIGTVKLIIDSEFERAALEQIKMPESVSYDDAVKCFEAINKLSQAYGISYISAKNIIEESMEILKAGQPNTECIIKDTIKEYLDKKFDDVTELLLALNKDLCERIRKENENGLQGK